MPERIQLSRKKGWTMSDNTISVARPGALGNRYKIYQHCPGPDGDWGVLDLGQFHLSLVHGYTKAGAAQVAVDSYRKLLDDVFPEGSSRRAALIRDLRGKNLACWCPLDQPCHADVLLELANS